MVIQGMCMCAKSLQLCQSLLSFGLLPTTLLCPWDSPGKNTEGGCQAHLQEIFLTQGSNPCLVSPALAGGFWDSQSLGRLIRSPRSPRRRKESGVLKEEIRVWNSQGGGKDKGFFPTFLSKDYIATFLSILLEDRFLLLGNLLTNPVNLKCKLWEWVW